MLKTAKARSMLGRLVLIVVTALLVLDAITYLAVSLAVDTDVIVIGGAEAQESVSAEPTTPLEKSYVELASEMAGLREDIKTKAFIHIAFLAVIVFLVVSLALKRERSLSQVTTQKDYYELIGMKQAMQAAGVGAWSWDMRAGTVKIDDLSARSLGIRNNKVSFSTFRDRFANDELQRFDTMISTAIDSDTGCCMEFKTKPDSEGHHRWLLIAGKSVSGDFFSGTLMDVTDKKNLGAVVETNMGLEIKNRSLEVTNKELEAFSYSVAHDLKAPVRSINGFIGMLANEIKKKELHDETIERYIEIIGKSSKRVGTLIDDLLSLTKINRQKMQIARLDMVSLFECIADELRLVDPDYSKVKVTIDQDLPDAIGDFSLVKQAVSNIMWNAMKFSKDVESPEVHVSFTAKDSGPTIYSVKDNGVGFDMKYYSKLFDIFQRLHSSKFDGTGVGLAIVERAISKHNGRVWAESEINKGSTFYFTLEMQDASAS